MNLPNPKDTARALRREAQVWRGEAVRLRARAATYETSAQALEGAADATEDVEWRRAAGERMTARALRREARVWLAEAVRLGVRAATYETSAGTLEGAAEAIGDVEKLRAAGDEEGDR